MLDLVERRPRRLDLTRATTERWKPPLHTPRTTRLSGWVAAARRIFDLQAATIWRDVGNELQSAEGLILDVGCGAQPHRGLVGAGARYLGIDTIDAKEHFGYALPDTVYFDGASWPIDAATVDLVLCTETLEHVLEPSTLLAEAHRTLRSGGRLLLTTPFAARWHFVPHDYWRFTPSSLKYLVESAGFVDVVVYARGNALTVACYTLNGLVFPLLVPTSSSLRARLAQILALPSLPLVLVATLIAQASLRGRGGDDCLGYTAHARRP